ncbi:MAG: ABC transporter substrate-binding protein [Clostridiaceae bacterium]|nr:ABC transporter substrate-binding protein [Clostridiaceae bacterium]
MTRKIITLTLALVMVLGLVLTGCSGNTGTSTTTAATTTAAATTAAATTTSGTTAAASTMGSTAAVTTAAPATTAVAADLEEVQLTWYNASDAFRSDKGPVKLEVAEWLNGYFKEKINATVEWQWTGWTDYNEKASAAINAGQPMDIMFTSQSTFPFAVWYQRGAFADLTDLLLEYAPETYTSIPEYVWTAASVEGRIYAMPTYKDMSVTMGLIYNKTMAEELGVEEELLGMKWSVAKELDEFYYKVKDLRDAAHSDWADIPLNEWRDTMHIYYEADNLASLAYTSIPGTPSFTGDEYANGTKVFNVYATDEYADAINLVTKWVTDGIVPYDSKNWDTEGVIKKSGKMFAKNTWGLVAVDEDQYENYKQGLMQPAVAFTYTGYPQAVMQAISAASKNQERAMMLLNLVFSDPQVSTTLRFGVEGKGWNLVEKDGVKRADFVGTYNEVKENRNNDGFYLWYHAEQGNLFSCYLPMDQDDNFFANLDAMNASAAVSPNMGFVFDSTNVDTEIAACAAVVAEYHNDLITGMVTNVAERIADFNTKLNANGAEKIIAEAQTQLDAWRASKG